MPKALLTENIHPLAARKLQDSNIQVTHIDTALSPSEVATYIDEISLLGVRSKTHLSPDILTSDSSLLTAAMYGIGVSHIDLKAAQEAGIAIFNAPFASSRSVAELALGEILAMIRGWPIKNQEMHRGDWFKTATGANEVRGKKLGLVGYGHIGSQLSVLAEFLGMEVYFYDVVEKMALGNAKACSSLEELLRTVEVVSIHVDGRPSNTNLIGEDQFAIMQEDVIFLNLARGSVIDYQALEKYLQNGKIKAAALDVFPSEPKGSGVGEFQSNLQQYDQVILTPHIGGSTQEAQAQIAEFATQKMLDYISTGDTMHSVNLPNIKTWKQASNHQRILHLHQNTPGILAKLNHLLAEQNLNIEAQTLKTNERVGYAIVDVSGGNLSQQTYTKLEQIPNTIRVRVI